MNMSDQKRCVDIPVTAMGPLLDLVGTPPERSISPRLLMGYPQPLSAHDRAALETDGVLSVEKDSGFHPDMAFEGAARVLLNPRTNLTVRLLAPAGEMETNVQFPAGPIEGGGVTLNRIQDRYRVKWHVSAFDIYSLLHNWFLLAVGDVPGHSFQALLDPFVATVFFGVADLLRSRNKLPESREVLSDLSFDKGELMEFFSGKESGGAAGDLRLYAALAMGRTVKTSGEDLDRVLPQLLISGALVQDASKYQATGVLEALGGSALHLERALHWHQVSLEDDGELSVMNRVAVHLGQDLMLVLDAMEEGVMIRAPSGKELLEDFRDELGQSVSGHDVATDAAVTKTPDQLYTGGDKSKSRRTEASLSTNGQALVQPTMAGRKCPSCRSEITERVKFCTKCGNPVGHVTSAPEPLVCPKCDTQLRVGAKFCTSCGRPVSAK